MSSIRSLILRSALAALPLLPHAAMAQQAADKVPQDKLPAPANLNVNGKLIPAIRAETMLREQTAQGAPDGPQLREAVREELIRREILTQEAVKKGLDKNPQLQQQMELARQAILIRAYLQDWLRTHPIQDADAKREYDAIKAQTGGKEYKARHVLLATEAEAKDVIAALNKGERIEDLAKNSQDPGSKDRGGDLGWSAPSSYVKPFADALVKLEKGKYTVEPVKSDFGYHVIQLDDLRDLQFPSLDEAKPQIMQRLQQKAIEAHMLDLRKKAKVN